MPSSVVNLSKCVVADETIHVNNCVWAIALMTDMSRHQMKK